MHDIYYSNFAIGTENFLLLTPTPFDSKLAPALSDRNETGIGTRMLCQELG